jgi:septum formation protein
MVSPALLLASSSPRRRQLLSWTGWKFDVLTANVDETPSPEESPSAYVMRLAISKGKAALALAPAGSVILAADTVVVEGDTLLGKPANTEEARSMLKRLRGCTHQVYTAIAVYLPGVQQPLTDLCVSAVPMRNYTDAEIDAYIASGDPLDKAGAYAIQNPDFKPVEHFKHCYASVMGLPLCHVARTMQKGGLNPPVDVALNCQKNLDYQCPVFEAILKGKA